MRTKNTDNLLSVIIPTYNEVENIESLLYRINKSLKDIRYEAIIVDDNSPDGTGKKADELSKKYPLSVIHRPWKVNLASAVLKGFEHARGNILCCIDADLSHPPEKIPELIEHIKKENIDIVVASRLLKDSLVVGHWPQHRRLNSYIAILIAKPLSSVKDSMSGFFCIKKEVIENIKLMPRGYKIGLEILVKGKYKRVKEVPFVFDNRENGKSKLNLKVQMEYLVQIGYLYIYHFNKFLKDRFAIFHKAAKRLQPYGASAPIKNKKIFPKK